MHQLQTLAFNFLDHDTENLLLRILDLRSSLRQKDQTCTVLTLFWYRNALQKNKLMRNLHHNARTVTCLVARLRTPVPHVFQHFQRIVHQLVALASVNVHHHAHTTGIVLICFVIESFIHLLSDDLQFICDSTKCLFSVFMCTKGCKTDKSFARRAKTRTGSANDMSRAKRHVEEIPRCHALWRANP